MADEASLKILVVEDNRTQAESLRYILEKVGHEVEIATDGLEGLERIGISRPDLVLSDVIMSPMDGYELCRNIKENPVTSAIPVILVTYLYNPSDVIKALEYGADNFIIKPYDADCIYSRINNTIQAFQQVSVTDKTNSPLDVTFSNHHYTIRSGRIQILNILLSTYETAIKNNYELQVADERLHYLNAQMQKAVADLKQANEELHKKNVERGRLETALDRSNKKFQYMGSIIHHILLTQLSSVFHNLEKGRTCQKSGSPDMSGYLDKAYGLVEKALNIVRITSETLDPVIQEPTWMPLNQVIRDALAEVAPGLVHVDCKIPGNIFINAFPLIEKVFSELIDNSIRHGKKTSLIRFTLEESQEEMVLLYEDDGVGIEYSDKKQIFSHEYGPSASHGLFLSEEILSVTGITICESGSPGMGVRFEITFPKGSIKRSGQ
jgi:CheY-like chemotaxis protein